MSARRQCAKFFLTILWWLCARQAGAAYGQSQPAAGGTVLNNFVTELLNVVPGEGATAEYPVVNPRDGWVFVSSAADAADGAVVVSVPSAASYGTLSTHRAGLPATQEAMRYLAAGTHRVRIECSGPSRCKRLIVRAIPEMLYSNFESHSQVAEYPRFTWDWLRQAGLLDNLTTIVGTRSRNNEAPLSEWKAAGRRWITEAGVPGFNDPSVEAKAAFDQWRKLDGMNAPGLDGLIVDEFYPSLKAKFPAWIEAIRLLAREDALKGRVFYPYCAGDPKGLASLVKATIECGYKFAYECYLKEQATEEKDWASLRENLPGPMKKLKGFVPDAQKHVIFVLGLLTAPPESNNTNPTVNFKTHLDMQMWLLANDPELAGTYGVMEYLSSYADEEYLRWYARLCRHYCIEGKKTRCSTDPYTLDHIVNPDFADGTNGWVLSPTGKGSIASKSMKGLSWLQGRYPRTTQGDTYLWMKRSGDKPNRVTQEIRNLQPGRMYSVKMLCGDLNNMTAQQRIAASITVDGTEPVPQKSFVHVYHNCYSHWLSDAEQKAQNWRWFNFHFAVFRAKAPTSRITISDWQTPDTPGGAVGQELMLNFIEVEPYFEG